MRVGRGTPSRDASAASNGQQTSVLRGGPSVCQISHGRGGGEIRFSREAVAELLEGGGFFWLDLDRPDSNDFEVLQEAFRFHPLAVEDSVHFEQRAKIEDYDDFVFLVVYGASPDNDRLVEVHCFYSERVPRHRSPRRLSRVRGDQAALPATRRGDRPSLAAAVPDRRRARRQLLPDPR